MANNIVQDIILGITKPFRQFADMTSTAFQSGADIVSRYAQTGDLTRALAESKPIQNYNPIFESQEEYQMVRDNPLMAGAQTAVGLGMFALPAKVPMAGSAFGRIGQNTLYGGLGGFAAANKTEDMPGMIASGALLGGGLSALGEGVKYLHNNAYVDPKTGNRYFKATAGYMKDAPYHSQAGKPETKQWFESMQKFQRKVNRDPMMISGRRYSEIPRYAPPIDAENLAAIQETAPIIDKIYNGVKSPTVANGIKLRSNNPLTAEFERLTQTYSGEELLRYLRDFRQYLGNDPESMAIKNVIDNLFIK